MSKQLSHGYEKIVHIRDSVDFLAPEFKSLFFFLSGDVSLFGPERRRREHLRLLRS